MGCIIKEIYSKQRVWPNEGMYDSRENVLESMRNHEIPDISKVPLPLRGFLEDCFIYDPELRPKIDPSTNSISLDLFNLASLTNFRNVNYL